MILLIEPLSTNIGMFVPGYPLPLMEIASFVKSNFPEIDIEIISIPIDYGLPLTQEGKEEIYGKLLKDISALKPKGIGISCTAIAQAEEVIFLCEKIKESDSDIFIFLGGYFPTFYYEEIFSRTAAVDLIVARGRRNPDPSNRSGTWKKGKIRRIRVSPIWFGRKTDRFKRTKEAQGLISGKRPLLT